MFSINFIILHSICSIYIDSPVFPTFQVQVAPLNQGTSAQTSAVIRVAAWTESVSVSPVTVDRTAAKPTVPETATTAGDALTDSVFATPASPAQTARTEAARTTATLGAGV